MILTDEEIEKCRELAFHAAKKSQQFLFAKQVHIQLCFQV